MDEWKEYGSAVGAVVAFYKHGDNSFLNFVIC